MNRRQFMGKSHFVKNIFHLIFDYLKANKPVSFHKLTLFGI